MNKQGSFFGAIGILVLLILIVGCIFYYNNEDSKINKDTFLIEKATNYCESIDKYFLKTKFDLEDFVFEPAFYCIDTPRDSEGVKYHFLKEELNEWERQR